MLPSLSKSKGTYEKTSRNLEDACAEVKSKYEDAEKSINEASACKARQVTEINELKRILEEKEALNSQLTRTKNSVGQNNEELRRQLEEETKAKNALQHQVQAAGHDYELLKEQFEEEQKDNEVKIPS